MNSKKNLQHSKIDEAWPIADLECVPNCPVCGSSARQTIHKGLQDKIFFCAPGKWNFHCCEGCGSGYLDPRPSKESIGLAYSVYYTHATTQINRASSVRARITRILANGYRNWRYGTSDSPSSYLGILVASAWPNGRSIIDTGMRHLPKARDGQRLLDIGCGSGAFLNKARSAGWSVTGIDLDELAVEQTSKMGLDVRHGDIDVLKDMESCFDYITMGHLIEHVHEPIHLLNRCFTLLKPGGLLWLETPNMNALGHDKFGHAWRGLEPPRHLVLFSVESLKYALRKSGFKDVRIQPYRAIAKSTYLASYAILNGLDPYDTLQIPLSLQKEINFAVKYQRNHLGSREFITLKAVK